MLKVAKRIISIEGILSKDEAIQMAAYFGCNDEGLFHFSNGDYFKVTLAHFPLAQRAWVRSLSQELGGAWPHGRAVSPERSNPAWLLC